LRLGLSLRSEVEGLRIKDVIKRIYSKRMVLIQPRALIVRISQSLKQVSRQLTVSPTKE
jgi:hypothetical protein